MDEVLADVLVEHDPALEGLLVAFDAVVFRPQSPHDEAIDRVQEDLDAELEEVRVGLPLGLHSEDRVHELDEQFSRVTLPFEVGDVRDDVEDLPVPEINLPDATVGGERCAAGRLCQTEERLTLRELLHSLYLLAFDLRQDDRDLLG